jgi:hypothetical protein
MTSEFLSGEHGSLNFHNFSSKPQFSKYWTIIIKSISKILTNFSSHFDNWYRFSKNSKNKLAKFFQKNFSLKNLESFFTPKINGKTMRIDGRIKFQSTEKFIEFFFFGENQFSDSAGFIYVRGISFFQSINHAPPTLSRISNPSFSTLFRFLRFFTSPWNNINIML